MTRNGSMVVNVGCFPGFVFLVLLTVGLVVQAVRVNDLRVRVEQLERKGAS